MFVYQDSKLYVQLDGDLAGVEIHSGEVSVIKSEKAKLGKRFELLTPMEVASRFGGEYNFPKKEVKKNDSVRKTKVNTKQSRSK